MEWMGQVGAVGLVMALLLVTMWWLKRRGWAGVLPVRRSGRRRMECLERLALGPQHTLHLIRLGDRTVLVAASPGGCTLMGRFDGRDGGRDTEREL